jgi:uncharacterized protein YjbI with pentapeptide repeats
MVEKITIRSRAIRRSVVVAAVCAAGQIASAQVYRWDNNQLCPGTAGITPGPGVNFSNFNTPSQTLQLANLNGLDLSSANFMSTELNNALLNSTNLTGAQMQGANLLFASLGNAIIKGTDLSGALNLTTTQITSTASYLTKDISGTRFNGLNLKGVNLTFQNLSSASFVQANLTSAVFGTTFNGTSTSSNLSSANFTSATLTSANFTSATIRGTNFASTTSRGFTQAQLYSTAGYQAFDLTGIGLASNNLIGWNFAGQTMTSASLASAIGISANFTAADLSMATAPGAKLTSANFTGANLTSASLPAANLISANFTAASLPSASLRSASLIYSNLTGADLTGADLTSADLTSANLTGAVFAASLAAMADLRGAVGFSASGIATLKGTILPTGKIDGFVLAPTESLRIRQGPIAAFTTSTITGNGTISVDAGANLQVMPQAAGGADARSLDGVQLAVNGTAAQPGHVTFGRDAAHGGTASAVSRVAVLQSLAIANDGGPPGQRIYSGMIDIGADDLIVRNGSIADLSDMARAGLYGPTLFTGNGITSSVAEADGDRLRYAVGIVQNSYFGDALYSTFDGVPVNTTDVLIKFTYFGDADLSGTVDDTDYFAINTGFLNDLSGWLNGDFDYNGVIDNTDYFLINNAFLHETSTLRTGGALPEPGGPLAGVFAVALLARRRR